MSSEEGKPVLEREYVIPLADAYRAPRKKRAKVAVRILREFVARHAKADLVKISDSVNKIIWSRSIEKPPRRIHVLVKVFEEEGVEVEKVRVAHVDLPKASEEAS
ncbi:MAG: 50S ribosomal protein L31e [Thermoprotei archaeon]|nr:MAG: 50S ribosomal protein L31e [Thermoprotei archaeon]